MIYLLKNTIDGSDTVYHTSVEIKEIDDKIIFKFVAKNSMYYCPYNYYNGIHARGDAVEILIGTDPTRKSYYEIEINPNNDKMLANMTYLGEDDGKVKLKIDFVEQRKCFYASYTLKTTDGYETTIVIDKFKLDLSLGDIYFNAYRLETDGGTMEKHLFALSPTMCAKFHVPSKFVFLKDYL